MSRLGDALGLEAGIVAAIGAGGKKSVLNTLASEFQGRLAWTGTVFTARPPRWTGVTFHIGSEGELLDLARSSSGPGRHAFLKPSDKPGRYAGLAPETVARLHQDGEFDLTLVKADGARMRGLKCPRPGEPVLPVGTTQVLMVLSAQVIGQTLDDIHVHRPERVAEVLDLPAGSRIGAEDLGAVFVRPGGLSEGTEGLAILPVINQVDDDERLALATRAARAALAQSSRFDRIVLTCLKRSAGGRSPVIAVIER